MQRRDFMKIATVGGLTATAALSTVPINLSSHQRRNVLFIAVDDLKPLIGAFGAFGATQVHTPHIDRLSKRGIIFKNNHYRKEKLVPLKILLLVLLLVLKVIISYTFCLNPFIIYTYIKFSKKEIKI